MIYHIQQAKRNLTKRTDKKRTENGIRLAESQPKSHCQRAKKKHNLT